MDQTIHSQIIYLKKYILQHVDPNPQSTLIKLLETIHSNFKWKLPVCKHYKNNKQCNVDNCIYKHEIVKNKKLCKFGNQCIYRINDTCEYSHNNNNRNNNDNQNMNNDNTNINNNNDTVQTIAENKTDKMSSNDNESLDNDCKHSVCNDNIYNDSNNNNNNNINQYPNNNPNNHTNYNNYNSNNNNSNINNNSTEFDFYDYMIKTELLSKQHIERLETYYNCQVCLHYLAGNCYNGDRCRYFHPSRCHFYSHDNPFGCKNGNTCPFAHTHNKHKNNGHTKYVKKEPNNDSANDNNNSNIAIWLKMNII